MISYQVMEHGKPLQKVMHEREAQGPSAGAHPPRRLPFGPAIGGRILRPGAEKKSMERQGCIRRHAGTRAV